MNRNDLEKRTLRFALKIIEFVATLPKNKTGEVIEFQLVKAGTSVGANYRETNRAESRNDFIHKLAIVEKESSESLYWLQLCQEAGLGDATRRQWLLQESRELLAIFTSAGRTSKATRGMRPTQNTPSTRT
jgi:four helix bundle protein